MKPKTIENQLFALTCCKLDHKKNTDAVTAQFHELVNIICGAGTRIAYAYYVSLVTFVCVKR